MKPIDLVLHDWSNLSPVERETAINDITALAATFGEASPRGPGRRARALNIVASYFHFLSGEVGHQARHAQLHQMLDELAADWMIHTGKRPSTATVLELMNWANEQRLAPTPTPER